MYRKYLIGLILLLCIFALLSCSKAPEQKPTPKGQTFDDLQAQADQPVKEFEENFKEEGKTQEGTEQEASTEQPEAATQEEQPSKEEGDMENKSEENKEETTENIDYDKLIAVVETNKGTFKIKFFHDTAPKHVENFIKLAKQGFYDGLTFHRYVPGFVIQGGDPQGTGSGGPGYTIPAEFSTKHLHDRGAVAAARLPDQANPKKASSGSQFYICLEPRPELDGNYTVWGQVIDGMDNVVMNLRQGDVMKKITIREKQ